jgi:HK97 gp10 family phage protein
MADIVEGLKELQDTLGEQTSKVAKRVLRRAAKDAGDIWVTAIIENAPHLTGFLQTHIGEVSQSTNGEQGGIEVKVGPDKRAWYAKFSEFGSQFQGAKPFMQPAFVSTKDIVLEAFVNDLRDELLALKEK